LAKAQAMLDSATDLVAPRQAPAAPVFVDGKKVLTLRGPNIAAEFKHIVEDYIERRFGPKATDNDTQRHTA
jgi:(E)-4-hydroxy-3-methylbut-2-enyl-diphosphate synthase